ncbi:MULTISPECIES: hypothetical protein [unclassified Streptomyces]|uniref:hypothetical protein n=1 Tax=unclassified Streptomyces TaxID=2593676 RepID=UPI002E81086C|nr:hypothetical protein [Streptomyces sp. NBC_00589]WTI37415.1 hypothetical protein OIC96_21565 [Streptomyces sp. NBC_00775]WUB28908.1 hypothetical protein OHA51_28170 [Streptomyces sp. NBC_00589]
MHLQTALVLEPAAVAVPTAGPPLVIGVDSSLTCTGIAGDGWADALRCKGKGHHRLRWLREEVRERTRLADLVVIEGAAYGRGGQAGHHELAGLWWILTQDLWERQIPYAVVNPHSRTIYATGSANPAKDHPKEKRARIAKGMVRDAVAERYGLECDGPGRYDKADAFILAAMGLHWAGWPLTVVPDSHRRALDAVPWPERNPRLQAPDLGKRGDFSCPTQERQIE